MHMKAGKRKKVTVHPGAKSKKNLPQKYEKVNSSEKRRASKKKVIKSYLSQELSTRETTVKEEPNAKTDELAMKKVRLFQKKNGKQKKFVASHKPDDKKKISMKRKHESEDGDSPAAKKEKLFQMKKKERKKFRQKSENKIFDLTVQMKQVWEEVRRDDCKPQRRGVLLDKLIALTKGHVYELIFAHDTVRVVECLVALGTDEHRNALFEELKEHILPLSKSKYAKFFVLKILKYGTKAQKDYILKSFHGKILHLLRHTQASSIVECGFNEYAGALQRSKMVQEFYGPSFTHFKEEHFQSLTEVLKKDPSQKASIINHMKEALLKIIDKPVLQHSIIHHALREFMTHADAQSRSEVIEALRSVAAEILHTKDGARVAMNCVWHGTAKDRKTLVKSLKPHVAKIAKEEFGHLVLLAVFDSVDDIKLVERIVLSSLMTNALELAQDQYGRRVLSYLLCPRDSHFFHPDVVSIISQGDGNLHSKKTSDLRKKEILDVVSNPLLKLAEDKTQELMANNATCLLLGSILQHSSGDKTAPFLALANLVAQPYAPDVKNTHVVELPGSHLLLKKLVLHDSQNKDSSEPCFSKILAETVPYGVMRSWTECNRGAFLLVRLLETTIPSVVSTIKKEMKGHHKALASKTFKGAQLLLQKLKQL